MRFANVLFPLIRLCVAAVPTSDPSDSINPLQDVSDNAIKADYNVPPVMYQINPIMGPYVFSGRANVTEIDHVAFIANENDTSVIVVTEGAQLNLSFVDIIKTGYGSNLLQESFFGLNAAINVANASTAYLDHVNITTHNGAANIFAFGTDTYVHVSDADLYSSGPTAHGLYASGNGTIYGTNIRHYSGGNRCSSFSGDAPAGYIYVTDAVAHTTGIGSAIFYALGSMHGTDVVGLAENSPAMFMDGVQSAHFHNVDFTAGLLAGIIVFSSMDRQAGAVVNFTNSRLTTLGPEMPGLWFGNTIATVNLYATEIDHPSGVLAVANYSQVTQEFNFFAGYPDNPNLQPAEATINVQESHLSGDLVAYNGSSITLVLGDHSSWQGAAYSGFGGASFAVQIDARSTWTLTADTTVQNFTSEDATLANVASGGYDIVYDASAPANAWLDGKTIVLNDGGNCRPLSLCS